ncbi:MAG: hypothetical protein ACK42E_04650 [Candidatus Bipolaricaulaceae bacterium]
MEKRLCAALEEALARYNEFRAPEAVAELVAVEGDVAKVRITGSFCKTCGAYDYMEDLLGYIEGEILHFEPIPAGFLVHYRIRSAERAG